MMCKPSLGVRWAATITSHIQSQPCSSTMVCHAPRASSQWSTSTITSCVGVIYFAARDFDERPTKFTAGSDFFISACLSLSLSALMASSFAFSAGSAASFFAMSFHSIGTGFTPGTSFPSFRNGK